MYLTSQTRPDSRIYGLIIGIEDYDFPGVLMRLPGCRAACRRFRDWLLGNGVEPDHIFLHLSPSHEGENSADFKSIGRSINRISQGDAETVFIYWAGHGYANASRRNVLLADSYDIGHGYDVDALIGRILQKQNLRSVVGIFDCCANPVDATFQLPSASAPPHDGNVETYVMFACGLGQVAGYDPLRGGEFSDELLSELETRAWPLDCAGLDTALQTKFAGLKQKGQRPVRYRAVTPAGTLDRNYAPATPLLRRVAEDHPLVAWLLRLLSNYASRYRAHILHDRAFNVKGLVTVGPFALDLAALYVEPFVRPTPPLDASSNPVAPAQAMDATQSIWPYLQLHARVAVLGPPGMGKTTLLRHVAHRLAGSWLARPVNRLPVFLSLQAIEGLLCSERAGDTPTLAAVVERSLDRAPSRRKAGSRTRWPLGAVYYCLTVSMKSATGAGASAWWHGSSRSCDAIP